MAKNWIAARKGKEEYFIAIHNRQVERSDATSIAMDLTSQHQIQQILEQYRIDICVHAAGLTSVEQCEEDVELAHNVNTVLAENVAKACFLTSVKLIHISTDHLFDGQNALTDEGALPKPLNAYGRTKAAAETAVLRVNPEALIARTNFFGWGPSYRYSFSDVIISSLRAKQPISLFTDVFFTPILATKLADICHRLLSLDASGIFNIVGDERVSKFEFGVQIATVFQLELELIEPALMSGVAGMVTRPNDMSLKNLKVATLLDMRVGGINEQLEELKKLELA